MNKSLRKDLNVPDVMSINYALTLLPFTPLLNLKLSNNKLRLQEETKSPFRFSLFSLDFRKVKGVKPPRTTVWTKQTNHKCQELLKVWTKINNFSGIVRIRLEQLNLS